MHIDPPRSGQLYKTLRKITATRAGVRLLSPILHVLDRLVLVLTSGRGTLTGALGGVAVVTVTTIGRRSGEPRSVPLLAIPVEGGIMVIASNWGRPRHPPWYHNLKANPRAMVTYRNCTEAYTAREAQGAERDALWTIATEVYPGYVKYQARCAPRAIPVIVLTPDA